MENEEEATLSQPRLCEDGAAALFRDEAQNLIDQINEKRKQDTSIITDMRKQMELQMEKSIHLVEQHMYNTYEQQGKAMHEKLADLFATLDRISKLETELEEFKHAVGSLFQEMN